MGRLRVFLCLVLVSLIGSAGRAQEPLTWTFDQTHNGIRRTDEFRRRWRGEAVERLRADIARKAWNGMGARMRAAAELLDKDVLDREIALAISGEMGKPDTRSYHIARAGVHLALEKNLPVSIAVTRELITATEDLIEDSVQPGLDSRLFLLESYIQAASGDQLGFVHALAEGRQAAAQCVREQSAEYLRMQKNTAEFSAESPGELLKGLLESAEKSDADGVGRYHVGWTARQEFSEYWVGAGYSEKTLAFYNPLVREIMGFIVGDGPAGVEWLEFDIWAACRYANVEFGFYRRMGRWYLGYAKLFRFFTAEGFERLLFPDDGGGADLMTFDRIRDVEWDAFAIREQTPDIDERLKLLHLRANRAVWESTASVLEFKSVLWSFAEDAGREKVSDAVVGLLKGDVGVVVKMACIEFAFASNMPEAREATRELIRTTGPLVLEDLLPAMMRVAEEQDVAFLKAAVAEDDCGDALKRLGALHLAAVKKQGDADRTPMSAHLHVQKTVAEGNRAGWRELYEGPGARRIQAIEPEWEQPEDTSYIDDFMEARFKYGFALHEEAKRDFITPGPAGGGYEERTLGAYSAIRTQKYEMGFRSYAGRWYPIYFRYPNVVARRSHVSPFE